MDAAPPTALSAHFASLPDPRVDRTKLHPLLSIVTIALCAVLCGAESWDEIAAFGAARQAWFASFLALPHGIPSHDTFNRVFATLDPVQFRACFLRWTQAIAGVLPAQVIAVDGKTLRRSHDHHLGKQAIHMVSAWATANRLVLAQVKVADKSNEITAIPELLRQLAIKGCLITIDAMGCQREIAQQIGDQQAAYILALKGNQGTLHADVQDSFAHLSGEAEAPGGLDYAVQTDKGHGRLEVRRHWVLTDPAVLAWIQAQHHWPGLQALGKVEAERRIGTTRSTAVRYYLLSHVLPAAVFGAAVRSHWGIENQVHWVLDLSFHEDDSRMRDRYAAENMSVLRHLALNLLRQQPPTGRLSLKARRKQAGWDHAQLLQLLTHL
jgi:predicted transposase YbfD/YdcC